MYNSVKQNNFDEIDKILNKDNNYVSIEQGSSKILQFNPIKKIEEVKKNKEKPFTQIRFIVIEPNSDNNEKWLDIGKKSARLIIAKLKEGYTLLKIERIGSGKDTLYIPTPVSSPVSNDSK